MRRFLLGFLLLGLLVGCKSTVTITSTDGKVAITVERGSFPTGVEADDVRVVLLENKKTLLFGDEEPFALYQLEPDGVALANAAWVTITVDGTAGKIPGLYHLSANGIEKVPSATTFDPMSGKATIVASIMHFSVLILKSEDFEVTATAPEYVFVGNTFDVTGTVNKLAEKTDVIVAESGTDWYDTLIRSLGLNAATVKQREIIGEIEIADPWSVEDKLEALDDSPVTPILHQEQRQNVNGRTHSYTKQFTCTEPGFITIRYNPSIHTPNTRYKSLTPKKVEMSTSEFPHTTLANEIECFDFIFCGGMRNDEALAVAMESCDGTFNGDFSCDSSTATWTIGMTSDKPTCTATCSVNAETKEVRVEGRCER